MFKILYIDINFIIFLGCFTKRKKRAILQAFLLLINPFTTDLIFLIFYPLEVVFRYRDPQLQVGKKYSDLFNLRPNLFAIFVDLPQIPLSKTVFICVNRKVLKRL